MLGKNPPPPWFHKYEMVTKMMHYTHFSATHLMLLKWPWNLLLHIFSLQCSDTSMSQAMARILRWHTYHCSLLWLKAMCWPRVLSALQTLVFSLGTYFPSIDIYLRVPDLTSEKRSSFPAVALLSIQNNLYVRNWTGNLRYHNDKERASFDFLVSHFLFTVCHGKCVKCW